MGLAASQAKLLSITSRLSTIELRSQQIARAKEALAMDTAELSKQYLDALNKTELTYATYNEDGEKVYTELTGSELMTYSPIKNQYALVNASGQVLVSEKDAANYEESANINEFLAKYGFEPIEEQHKQTVVNPAYEVAYEKWTKEHEEWLERKPDKNDEKYWTHIVEETVIENNLNLYDDFIEYNTYTSTCLYNAANNNRHDCFYHVLSDLIGPGTHTTSDGNTFTCDAGAGGWTWSRTENPRNELIRDLSQRITEAYCSGYVVPGGKETIEAPYGTVEIGGPSSDKNMTIYQRAVDLLWEVSRQDINDDSKLKIFYFIEKDLKNIVKETVTNERDEFDEEQYNEDYEKWLSEEPQMEEVEQTIEEVVKSYKTPDNAQWYVNLWHRMNGESQEKDGYTTNQFSTTNTLNGIFTNQKRWDILEDGLMNSAAWLKNALETGAITIERVNYANPTEAGTGVVKAEWKAVTYNNALDIVEKTDSKAVAKAEADYARKQKVLEDKDKQYDSVLKLLDTEHSALQTEYESVKSVVAKNTERTLKIYSA